MTDDGTNVLLLDDWSDDEQTERDPLDPGGTVAELHLTTGGGDGDPGAGAFGDRRPARKGLVVVGDTVRSARATGDGPDFSGPVAVDAVEDPTDLRSIGVAVSEFCERWGDHTFVVRVDALGTLLDHSPPDAVFRFCHVLTRRLSQVDAVARFHLDPERHPDPVVATFEPLFDEVVRPRTDDEDDARARIERPSRQASDGDVAAIAADQGDDGVSVVGQRRRPLDAPSEATDEDVSKALGE